MGAEEREFNMNKMKPTTEPVKEKGGKSVRCNHKCLECTLPDCQNDVLTASEKAEARLRDINFMNYGHVMKQRPTKRKPRYV